MPSLYDGLEFFDFLRGLPGVYLVVLTAGLLLALRDWRWSLVVFTAQYLIAGLLLAEIMAPHLAFIKVIVGLFAVLILYLTGRQVRWARLPVDLTAEEADMLRRERQARVGSARLSSQASVRSAMAAIAVFAVWFVGRQPAFFLPQIPDYLNLAVFSLAILGLLNVSTTAEPFMAGIGMLTFMTGFELFYGALERAEAMLAVLALVNLAVAVVVAYLTQTRYTFPALWERLERTQANGRESTRGGRPGLDP